MIVCIGVFFYLGAALYIAAGVMAVVYLRRDSERALDTAIRLAAAGAACLAVTFLFRWFVWRLVPMTTVSDSINLLVLLSTLVMLFLMQKRNVRALACFYLPPLAGLCVVSAVVAHKYLFAAPRELPGLPLAVHVGSSGPIGVAGVPLIVKRTRSPGRTPSSSGVSARSRYTGITPYHPGWVTTNSPHGTPRGL